MCSLSLRPEVRVLRSLLISLRLMLATDVHASHALSDAGDTRSARPRLNTGRRVSLVLSRIASVDRLLTWLLLLGIEALVILRIALSARLLLLLRLLLLRVTAICWSGSAAKLLTGHLTADYGVAA